MPISVTKLDAVRGDSNAWNFSYTGEALSQVTFTVASGNKKTLIVKTLSDGITPIEGGYRVVLRPIDTSDLDPVLHVFSYDLEGITPLGDVYTLFQGPLYIFTDVKP